MNDKDDTDEPTGRPTGLLAIWANTLEPVAPLPWYRRVPRKAVIAGVVIVGLFTALTVAAVTGAGAPPQHRIVLVDRIGDQVRLADDGDTQALSADYKGRMTALSPNRDLTVAGYGAPGTSRTALTVVGLTGSYADPLRELDKYFGRLAARNQLDPTAVSRVNYPAGPLGGLLDCARLVHPTASETTCAWADGTTVGMVTDRTGGSALDDLATRTLAIREAVEVEVKD